MTVPRRPLRQSFQFAALCAIFAAASEARAQESSVWNGDCLPAACCAPAEPGCCADAAGCGHGMSYGPCGYRPRKTLMQWSYGTSFEGGAPGPDEPLATDRPDFTEASVTVGRGVAQVEMGYTYIYDNDGQTNLRADSYPEMLWRVGIFAEWLELRIEWNYLEEEIGFAGGTTTFEGAEDLRVGCKLALTPQECLLPETALILQTRVPTGADVFTADELLPGVNYIYAWEINDRLSTAGSTQFNRALDGETGEPFLEFAQSWVVGLSLTDEVGAYAEWFGIIPSGADTERAAHFFDGGFTVLLSNDIQWDIRAGVGLNDTADDYFVGTGLSVRLY